MRGTRAGRPVLRLDGWDTRSPTRTSRALHPGVGAPASGERWCQPRTESVCGPIIISVLGPLRKGGPPGLAVRRPRAVVQAPAGSPAGLRRPLGCAPTSGGPPAARSRRARGRGRRGPGRRRPGRRGGRRPADERACLPCSTRRGRRRAGPRRGGPGRGRSRTGRGRTRGCRSGASWVWNTRSNSASAAAPAPSPWYRSTTRAGQEPFGVDRACSSPAVSARVTSSTCSGGQPVVRAKYRGMSGSGSDISFPNCSAGGSVIPT